MATCYYRNIATVNSLCRAVALKAGRPPWRDHAFSMMLSKATQQYKEKPFNHLFICIDALGVRQTKYFTQGYWDVLVVPNHNPLTKIFGDRI